MKSDEQDNKNKGQKVGDGAPKEVEGKLVREPKEEGNRDGSKRDNTTVVIGGDQHEDARLASEKMKTMEALPMGGMTMLPPTNQAEAKKLADVNDKAQKEADKSALSPGKTKTSGDDKEDKK